MRERLVFIGQGLAVALLALVVYLPGFHGSFQLDDVPNIIHNSYLDPPDFSSHSLLAAAFQDGGNNRPVVNLSLLLNRHFNGDNPFGFHIVNFAVLLLTAFGVWALLLRLLSRLGYPKARVRLASWFCVLVWVCHPVNVQAITYVIQRYASMAGMFSVWTLAFYHYGMESRRRRPLFFILAGFCGLLAMLSKETAILVPLIVLAYKIFFFDDLKPGCLRANRFWIIAILLFYAMAGLFFLRPSLLQAASTFDQPFTNYQRLLTEPKVLLWYPLLVILPFPQFLSLFHTFEAAHSWLDPWTTTLYFSAILALGLAAVLLARRARAFSFAALWYFANLAVETMPLPIDLAHEHRLFLAMLAIIVPAVSVLILRSPNLKMSIAIVTAIMVFFSFFTYRRNQIWSTQLTLWNDTLRKAPDFSSLPWRTLCQLQLGKNIVSHTGAICRGAAIMDPNKAIVHSNLGVYLAKTGQLAAAAEQFKKALALDTEDKKKGEDYFNLGMIEFKLGNYSMAEQLFQLSVQNIPQDWRAHYSLAETSWKLWKQDIYLDELEKAVKLKPEASKMRAELASALAEAGNCRKALTLIREAPSPASEFLPVIQTCGK